MKINKISISLASFLTGCAWCKKFLLNGHWVKRHDLENSKDISHGICPTCYKLVRSG